MHVTKQKLIYLLFLDFSAELTKFINFPGLKELGLVGANYNPVQCFAGLFTAE